MSRPQVIGSDNQRAYSSLMQGLQELDLRGNATPGTLYLMGDHAFPLAMNMQGQVLMAASLFGRGRMVVLGHERYLTTLPALVENTLTWLRGDGSENLLVGIHQSCKPVADNLDETIFHGQVVEGFRQDLGVGVYVVDAWSMAPDVKSLVEFLKAGGGLLIAGQAWSWAGQHPKENVLLAFPGNKVSSVAGIYFTEHFSEAKCLSVFPPIPCHWNPDPVNFKDDLAFLLEGVSEFELKNECSEIQVHGHLAFPISTFLAGAYYGRGRVICVTHEALFGQQDFVPLWHNALRWLDQGRKGVVGVHPSLTDLPSMYGPSGLSCLNTDFTNELSVFVCTAYCDKMAQEMQDFVMEGGGLLIGGHAWYWCYCYPALNLLTDFAGNRILSKMGLNVLGATVQQGVYEAPDPDKAFVDHYHFHHMVSRFAKHVINGETLTAKEEGFLTQLRRDCATYLLMEANESVSYRQVVSHLTDIVKKAGIPQVSVNCPVSSVKDRLLLTIGAELYKCLDPDTLLPYLIRDNPSMPVVQHHQLEINANTAGQKEWISTGLYLSPGMKTYISLPAQIVNNGWKVQIGCQVDGLDHLKELRRAPCVHKTFNITTPMMQVWNLWGGLLYLVAPSNTQAEGLIVTVERAVLVPYYKSGVTTLAEWAELRTSPAPWAELEFDNIILTIPSSIIRDMERPDEVAALWDDIMKAIADLAVVSPKFPRKERFVADVQISHGFMHAGYPIMMLSSVVHEVFDLERARTHGLWGYIHELGHNQQRGCWEFAPHTTECTCNLWSVYVHEEVLGINRAEAHPALQPKSRASRPGDYVKQGKDLKTWNTWVALETYLQLQEAFGWGAFKNVFAAYQDMADVPKDNNGKMNLYTKTFSMAVEKNLCAFFKAWGWPIEAATEKELSGLPLWSDHPMVLYK
ncbi:TRPM8 channel-associated factor [Merluccius polli]|uniref:TRPM8 channel-associated factor n=1 Tax=Merluccius polli TaxID=89951 RepID=A0AA47N9R4_MERPO|nr:TRPM8 channel-associated factor [Merluccius polli]